MKIGVQLPEVEWEVPLPELIAMARSRRGGRLRLAVAGRPPAVRPPRSGHAGRGRLDLAGRAGRVDHRRVELGPLVASTASMRRRCSPSRRRPSTPSPAAG